MLAVITLLSIKKSVQLPKITEDENELTII